MGGNYIDIIPSVLGQNAALTELKEMPVIASYGVFTVTRDLGIIPIQLNCLFDLLRNSAKLFI